MKHLRILIISAVVAIYSGINAYSYEVFEHGKGDEEHLVDKATVMEAEVVLFDNFGIWANDIFGIFVLCRDIDGAAWFNPSEEGSYVSVDSDVFRMVDEKSSENGFIQELKVFYEPLDTMKSYRVIVTTDKGVTTEAIYLPTFLGYGEEPYLKVVGSEKFIGNHPVFLEWLEHWAKKRNFRFIDSDTPPAVPQ